MLPSGTGVAQPLIQQPDGSLNVEDSGADEQDVTMSNEPATGDRDEPERAPETPPDEPKPAPVQDPPAEPGRPPLVVSRVF